MYIFINNNTRNKVSEISYKKNNKRPKINKALKSEVSLQCKQ